MKLHSQKYWSPGTDLQVESFIDSLLDGENMYKLLALNRDETLFSMMQ